MQNLQSANSKGNNLISMRNPMTKMFATMIFLGLAMISTAYAQASQPIQAKVPFNFTVQGTTFAAGTYRMTYSDTTRILYVRGVEHPSSGAFLRAIPESAPGASKRPAKLVFHCYDNACYLAQVWQGSISGDRRLEVSQPARERDLGFETRVLSMTIPTK